jgi:hypothetical protein
MDPLTRFFVVWFTVGISSFHAFINYDPESEDARKRSGKIFLKYFTKTLFIMTIGGGISFLLTMYMASIFVTIEQRFLPFDR